MMELDKTFSQTDPIGHNNQQWSNIIGIKAQELSNYLVGNRKGFDLSKPDVRLDRVDNNKIREKIKNMSYAEWVMMGGSKGTLHYMKKNSKKNKPFRLYDKVKNKMIV